MNKNEFYTELQRDTKALLAGETEFLPIMANASALLYHRLNAVNWVGFYLLTSAQQLLLGPFQGKIACVRIPIGHGVCGTAVATGKIQRVADVHQFSGHIACDADTNSEIVFPLAINNEIIGVLDIDSIEIDRFDEQDQQGLLAVVDILNHALAGTYLKNFLSQTAN